jgi:NIMA (never in mitosis gene a)-related kinase
MERQPIPPPYKKVKKLGEGGFGITFLVEEQPSGDQYCLKITRLESDRERVRQEATLLYRFNHSNIIRYHKSFEQSGFLFIFMDFADDGDVAGKLNRHRISSTSMPESTV